jgi:predicted permease
MRWWRRLIGRARLERELDAELRDHVQRQIADHLRAGLTEPDARRRALLAFGGVEPTKEACRDVRRTRWLEDLGRDLHYGVRVLRKSPGFTTAAVLSLALGIGANTAIFTLFDQILLRPLPVDRPHELALVRIDGMFNGTTSGDGNELSYPMYADFRDHNDVFSGMFARFGRSMHVGDGERTERVNGELVSGSYFDVLGIRAAHGRLFTPQDDRVPNGHPVVVLGHRYWRERFAEDPAVVGRALTLNGHPYTVVGVAEERFGGMNVAGTTHVFVPMMMQAHVLTRWNFLDDRRSRFAQVYGRLRPGISFAQAEASLRPFFRVIREQELREPVFAGASDYTKQEFLRATIQVVPGFQGVSRLRRTVTRPLWAMTAIVAALLLIACANVAALLVARGTARQREIAIRLALGGSRLRIIRQLLVETLLIALGGAASGILIATWGSSLLLGLLVDAEASPNIAVSPDLRILVFNFGVALGAVLIVGLMPAWQATRPAPAATLKDHAASVAGGRHVLIRKGLVVAEVALSLLLLVGAGLFVRSLTNLLAEHPGFTTAHLVSFSVDASLNGQTGARAQEFHRTLLERVAALPGVTAAGLTSHPVLQGFAWQSTMTVEGYRARDNEEVVAYINAVTPGYFDAMEIPILAGRAIAARDMRVDASQAESPFRVAVANQRFVERYLSTTNPIGKRVGFGGGPNAPTPIEIVGVAGNAKYRGVRDDLEPQLFLAFFEHPGPDGAVAYIRTTEPPERMFAALRRTVQEIDPTLPLFRMRTMDEQVRRSLANERLLAGLSAVFGLLATLLAVVGLYGVMAYAVTERRREIGIRVALGARSGQVIWLFLREAVGLVVSGCALAVPVLVAVAGFMRSQLYGIQPLDPATIATAILALGAAAAAGAFVPARRGARNQPLQALRED